MQQRSIVQDEWTLTLGKRLVGQMGGGEGCEAGVMGY